MNTIEISDVTLYELKKVKDVFKRLNIKGDSTDEILKYSLRLVMSISNLKLPGEYIK